MPLPSLAPMVAPALAGEGVWTTEGLPAASPGLPAPVVKTFVRPDPVRPYAIVTMLQFDLRDTNLHMVAGIQQPGGSRGLPGPGVIPSADQQGGALLATFNGAFKEADGAGGMMVDGTVYVPPIQGAATVAVTANGRVIMGTWGVDWRLNSGNTTLVAWRQNGPLLLDHGVMNPLTYNAAAWGISILDHTYTWRSALGLTNHGTLLYAAGNALSAATLARALRAAGAVTAMQTDINPFWVRAFTYGHDAAGNLTVSKLYPAMAGTGAEYLYGDVRDFFYVTRAGLHATR